MNEVIEHSVTKADHVNVKKDGIYRVMVPFGWDDAGLLPAALPAKPPPYWSHASDQIMRMAIHHEGLWGATVGIACSKFASLGWDLTGSKVDRMKQMLHSSDEQKGWVSFTNKICADYIGCDNGAFYEIVKKTNKINSRVLGVEPLDSARCRRTGDPDYPVVYTDRESREHIMRRDQVVDFVDMPSTAETWNGIGTCATRRAWRQIVKLAAMEMFIIEKITGRRPLALYLVNGVMPETLESIKATAEADANARGVTSYMGVVMAGLLGEAPAGLITIPFAELPDGFARKEEFDISVLVYADSIGIDIQDIQPLSGQGLGTGTQSITLGNKAKGKGLSVLRQGFTHSMNKWVLPERTTFTFSEKDFADLKAAAEIDKMHTDNYLQLKKEGVIRAEQVMQLKVDLDELPEAFLTQPDSTPIDSVADSDGRAEAESDGQDEAQPAPLVVTGIPG
jgi:hypothetical protein